MQALAECNNHCSASCMCMLYVISKVWRCGRWGDHLCEPF